ncbi:MAG: family transporter [Actinomycetia bacterium]|nr:family transporter [Actinomycetes bacterium]
MLAALVTVVLWASAFVGIRSAGHELSAGPLALARLAVAAVVLGLVVLFRRERLPVRSDLPAIALCGALWFAAYNVLLNAGERRVDAGTAAMVVNIGPILIAVLAGKLLKEGFPRPLLVGAAIAFGGTTVIGLATSTGDRSSTYGVLLCVLAAITYAGGVVVQKPLLTRVSALQVTWLACTVGFLLCLPYAPVLWRELGHASGGAIGWAVYLGALPTAVAFTTWAYALAHTTAGRMGTTTYLVPPLVILLSWLLLGESPPILALAGGVLCLVGVAVTRRRR